MAIEGIDYAWTKPTPSALLSGGKQFVCRYLSYRPNDKNLTKIEADTLQAAGISIVCNWEQASGDARKGYGTGVAHATEARNQAIACGMPNDRPIYFSVDFQPSSADYYLIADYFRGIRSVLGYKGCGVYGGYGTVARAVEEHWCGWYWQTYAWSNGRWHPAAHIQQYHNGVQFAGCDVDLNRAMTDDYGQWKNVLPAPTTTKGYLVDGSFLKEAFFVKGASPTVLIGNGLVCRGIPNQAAWDELKKRVAVAQGTTPDKIGLSVYPDDETAWGVAGSKI